MEWSHEFTAPLLHRPVQWLSARLQYPQCISNGDTAVLYLAILVQDCGISSVLTMETLQSGIWPSRYPTKKEETVSGDAI